MKSPEAWALIGHGNIGGELTRQVGQAAVAERIGLRPKPEFIVERDGIMAADGRTPTKYKQFADIPELPDVLFLAIPSSNDGKLAYGYISEVLKQGKMAVTAEKGAMANFFTPIRDASDNFQRFGNTATVGGGTRMMRLAHEYSHDVANISQMYLALNGTLAAVMDWVSPMQGQGIAVEKAAKQAVDKGYAEPGSSSASAIIKAEAEGDIPKKLAIFSNVVGLSEHLLDWESLRFSLSEAEIAKVLKAKVPHRFLVSASRGPQTDFNEDDVIGGFRVDHHDWRLVGGFQPVTENSTHLIKALATLSGPGNGLSLGLGPKINADEYEDGVYVLTGPGAGVGPTVNTMLDDYVRLKNLRG